MATHAQGFERADGADVPQQHHQEAAHHVEPGHQGHQDEDDDHVEIQQSQPVEYLRITGRCRSHQQVFLFRVAAVQKEGTHPQRQPFHLFPRQVRCHAYVQAGNLVGLPAVQALQVLQAGIDQQVVVQLQEVLVHSADGEFSHPHLFADKIDGEGIAHAQPGNLTQPPGDGYRQSVMPDLIGHLGNPFHQHPVHGLSLLDNAGSHYGGLQPLHPGQGQESILGGEPARHGHAFLPAGTWRNANLAGKLAHPLPDGTAEAGGHGYRYNNNKETDGDSYRRHVSLKSKFSRYEPLRYQMCTRSSSGRNIGSPSWMSQASKKVWKLRTLTFTRFTASECGSRLVRRAFSWSVMFWAQMAP